MMMTFQNGNNNPKIN